MRNSFLTPRDNSDNSMSVIEGIQGLASFSMQVRKNIIELQNALPSDEKYDGLRGCLEDSKKSIQTTIKKLSKGYAVAFDLELEV